jgi:hypothetical protein
MISGHIYINSCCNYKITILYVNKRLHIPLAANVHIALASSSLWLPQVLQVSGMFEKMDLQADIHHQTKIS